MFPLRDSTPRKSFPFINYLIILINIVIFIMQLAAPDPESFVLDYAFIPVQFHFTDIYSYTYIITAMFLHGGFLHLISNMWFLHIFGDNVEDVLGHFRYLLFYLASGVAATLLQYYFMQDAAIPLIGASGAISGIAGAYFVLFRHSKVVTLVTYFFWIWDIIELPVWFFLGYWFIIQLFNGIGSVVALDYNGGGVAWFAHVGGFLFGYLLVKSISPNFYRQS